MSADVYRETVHAARKAHRCDCCPVTITPGMRYVRHFSVYEGEAYSAARCLPCRDMVRAVFDANDPDFELYIPELHDDVCELESDPETRPLALAWHARCGRPVRYVGARRFGFDWSGSARADVRIVTVSCRQAGGRCGVEVIEVRGPLASVDVDALRARFLAASDDELLAMLAQAEQALEPQTAWPEAA